MTAINTPSMGIYLITNSVNGHRYVGMSRHLKRRIAEHKTPSRRANDKTPLSRAFKEFGIENFNFEVIEYVTFESELPEKEVIWIGKLSPEYNICEGGLGVKGRVLTDAEKLNLSKIGKSQWDSKTSEERQNVLDNQLKGPKKGHAVSESTRQKLRDANLGKVQSFDTIKKRSIKLKETAKGNKNGNKAIVSLLNGAFVKEYESTKIAADELGIHPSSITVVLKGKRKTSKGFEWKYKSLHM